MPFDKSKFTKKLKDKYSFKDETFKRVHKNNPSDKIEVEIGDSKQPDFKPQHKVMRWHNECNVSIRLKDDGSETETVETRDDKIVWKKGKREAHFYDFTNEEHPEGAQEFEIVLLEKPATNVVEFTLQDKDVEYFYQPALTPEEIAEGASRPENVVGSYAVYAKTPKTNWNGGKEYKTGKVGHIFRPRIEDAKGNWTWGELHIENGILSVTIPQEFLDTAVYPVKHAAGLTFGYTTLGSSFFNTPSGQKQNILASIVGTYTASTGDTITKYSVGGKLDSAGSRSIESTAYTYSGGVPTDRLAVASTITFTSTTNQFFHSGDVSQTLTNGVTYCIGEGINTTGSVGINISYDSGSPPGRLGTSDANHTELTDPFGPVNTDSGRHYSIYATYTASGGGSRTLMLMGMGT